MLFQFVCMSFADRYIGSSGIDPPCLTCERRLRKVGCEIHIMTNKAEKEPDKPVPTNTAAKIREHLSTILTSEIFVRSERLSRFLRFVVGKALEGRGDEISEYSIGVEVYDRPTAFDPRIDSTVRVEAGRLRAKLREYYEAEGTDSPIRIQLPKGRYSPSFREIASRSEKIEAEDDATGRETLKSIAVLPFADLSPAHDQEYFGYGIAEELMFALSRLRQLRVASQTSAFALKETLQDVREICKKLDVDAVLEGSVRKHEIRLRVTAQLVDASSGYRLWSEVYDRELEDIFKIQEDISGSVVSALSAGFLSLSKEKVAKAPTGSVEAYEAYLRGRHLWNRQSEESLRMAIREFEQAITEDPRFARAHVGVSDCYRLLEFWGALSPKEAYPKAKEAAAKALELDGSLPEARGALAVLMAVYDWDWAAAERQFHQVFDALPGYPIAHQAYGMMCLAPQGRLEEMINQLKLARELDPLALWVNAQLGIAYFFNRKYDEAVAQLKKTLELDGCFNVAHMFLGGVYAHQHRLEEALAALQTARLHGGDTSRILGWTAYVNGLMGRKRKASNVAEELEGLARSQYVCPVDLARIYLGIGNKDRALARLHQAADLRCGRLIWTVIDPSFEPVWTDERFSAIRSRMNL
jgi:TolB-like protein